MLGSCFASQSRHSKQTTTEQLEDDRKPRCRRMEREGTVVIIARDYNLQYHDLDVVHELFIPVCGDKSPGDSGPLPRNSG